MDVYVVKIAKYGLTSVEIQLEECTSDRKYSSQPFLEHILSVRKPSIYGVSLSINNEKEDVKGKSESWKNIGANENCVVLSSDDAIERNEAEAVKILMDLSDALPTPGSYLLHIIYDFRGRNIMDGCLSSGMAGVIKKLCFWHKGHLHVYTDCELSDHNSSVFDFMDPYFQIHQFCASAEVSFKVSTNQIWQGHLSLHLDDMESQPLRGFVLSKIHIEHENELMVYPKTSQVKTDGYDDAGFVWIGPEINILARVDVMTVPLMYYSGRAFRLEYRLNPRCSDMNEALQRMCDSLTLKPRSAFLCCLNYAISGDHFINAFKLSSEYWLQAILKCRGSMTPPVVKLEQNISSLYFLLRLTEQDGSEHSSNVKQFTCHLLNRHEEIDWKIPLEHFRLPPLLRTSNLEDEPTISSPKTYELQAVNILPLMRRYNHFKLLLVKALKEWLGNEAMANIPGNQLASLVSKSLQTVGTELARSCKEPVGIHEFSMSRFNSFESNVYELQKQALETAEENKNGTNSMLARVGQCGSSSGGLNMHFKPQDILKHFLQSGKSRGGLPIVNKPGASNLSTLHTDKSGSFTEMMNSTHHGILYNVDELESEKYDKACRRLVERCVKYETCSIGSIGKVPSHSIILAGDSPLKNPSTNAKSSTKIVDKRKHLKKVAEKLHRKRIETRRSTPSVAKPPSTAMVLRSTPKKSQVAKPAANHSIPMKEQNRHKRRTYVRDNKKRLEELVAKTLLENGVPKTSKRFETCSRRLYNVSMAFLRDLKSSKDLEKIMKETVSNNVQSVIMFRT